MANSISHRRCRRPPRRKSHRLEESAYPTTIRTKRPKRRPSGNGQLRTIIEGKAWPRPGGLGIGVGGPYSRPHPRRPGMTDPKAAAGRHGQREHRQSPCCSAPDLPERFRRWMTPVSPPRSRRARNTWLAEYCAENPKRIKGTAALAQQDISASVEELCTQRERTGLRRRIDFSQRQRPPSRRSLLFSALRRSREVQCADLRPHVSRTLRLRRHRHRARR